MILLTPFTELVEFLQRLTNASPKLTIAYAHLIFNVANTLLLVWFVKEIIWIIKKIIPGKDDLDKAFNIDVFNERLIEQSPILALESSKSYSLYGTNCPRYV